MGYRYLMIFYEEQAMVMHFEKKEKLQYITNKGEKIFPISEDFWEWWKGAASYIDGEAVDFCFLYDKEYEVLNTAFKWADNSEWNMDMIRAFFADMTDYSRITLIGRDGAEEKIRDGNKAFADDSEKVFYTNLCLDYAKKDMEMKEEQEATVFARYFQKLLAESADNK